MSCSGVGAQHEETIVAFFLGDLFIVNREVATTLTSGPAIAFISNETLVAPTQLLAQGLEDCGAVVRIFRRSSSFYTDDIAAALD